MKPCHPLPIRNRAAWSRVERGEHVRILNDPVHAEPADGQKPDHHDRPEERADSMRPVALNEKQREEDGDRGRDHDRLEHVGRNRQALDGAQHRDGRCDHAVAVEQGRAEQAQRNQPGAAAPPGGRLLRDQGHERQDAAFALVVGAHDEDQVLDRDDERQRVENQRQHAEYVVVCRRDAMRAMKAFLQGIEHARADVAIDDSQRPKCQYSELSA